jgi:hypothetical protein
MEIIASSKSEKKSSPFTRKGVRAMNAVLKPALRARATGSGQRTRERGAAVPRAASCKKGSDSRETASALAGCPPSARAASCRSVRRGPGSSHLVATRSQWVSVRAMAAVAPTTNDSQAPDADGKAPVPETNATAPT